MAGGDVHAVRYDDGGRLAVDLGTLPGGRLSYGYGINEAGLTVGGATVNAAGTLLHAFVHTPGIGMRDLGTVDGFNSFAQGINGFGTIVGNLHVGNPASDPPARAFLYTPERAMVDLNTLVDPASGWTLQAAFAINDAGQIVGYVRNPDGASHAFLLSPITGPPVGTLPVVSVVGAARERGGFLLSRSADAAGAALTVAYHNGGSAQRGVDYEAFSGVATFDAGESETVIPVRLLPGANRNKKVKVFLEPAPAGDYDIGKAQSKVFLSDLP